MEQVSRAVYSWSGSETSLRDLRGQSDLPAFVRLVRGEPWLLGEEFVEFQTGIIERATLVGRGEFTPSFASSFSHTRGSQLGRASGTC